jgi:ribosomal protein S18 acetylase RimI-like enzyme
MQFTLSPEITDQIIFAMENQTEKTVFDTEAKETLKESLLPKPVDTGRYVDIPEWNSFSGFQLMEKFVAGLRNPVYREALRNALSRGRGVFRQFKDVLKENREMERLWYSFKEKEMKRLVKEWYLSLSELWGCENLDGDLEFLEETEDIIAEDFIFDTAADDIGFDTLKNYDKSGFFEAFAGYGPLRAEHLYSRRNSMLPEMDGPASKYCIARSPAGEFAGFIRAVSTAPKELKIVQIYILEEFRGLGLAAVLADHFIGELTETGEYQYIDIELAGSGLALGKHFEHRNFSLTAKTYTLNCRDWDPEGKIDV